MAKFGYKTNISLAEAKSFVELLESFGFTQAPIILAESKKVKDKDGVEKDEVAEVEGVKFVLSMPDEPEGKEGKEDKKLIKYAPVEVYLGDDSIQVLNTETGDKIEVKYTEKDNLKKVLDGVKEKTSKKKEDKKDEKPEEKDAKKDEVKPETKEEKPEVKTDEVPAATDAVPEISGMPTIDKPKFEEIKFESVEPANINEATSKKDYIAVAEILKKFTNKKDVAVALADYFKKDNPAFDRDRFLDAANVELRESSVESVKTSGTDSDEETAVKGDQEVRSDITEHVNALLSGEQLTEEFKTKASVIFSAALNERTKAIQEEQNKLFESKVAQAAQSEYRTLAEVVDKYLTKLRQEWLTENKIALESGVKQQLTENFIGKLKNLFTESFVEVPETKLDLFAKLSETASLMETKNADLTKQLSTQTFQMKKLQKKIAIVEACRELSAVGAEKLQKLAEGVEFTTAEKFTSDIKTLMESYNLRQTPVAAKETKVGQTILTESVTPEIQPGTNLDVQRYAKAISDSVMSIPVKK